MEDKNNQIRTEISAVVKVWKEYYEDKFRLEVFSKRGSPGKMEEKTPPFYTMEKLKSLKDAFWRGNQ